MLLHRRWLQGLCGAWSTPRCLIKSSIRLSRSDLEARRHAKILNEGVCDPLARGPGSSIDIVRYKDPVGRTSERARSLYPTILPLSVEKLITLLTFIFSYYPSQSLHPSQCSSSNSFCQFPSSALSLQSMSCKSYRFWSPGIDLIIVNHNSLPICNPTPFPLAKTLPSAPCSPASPLCPPPRSHRSSPSNREPARRTTTEMPGRPLPLYTRSCLAPLTAITSVSGVSSVPLLSRTA